MQKLKINDNIISLTNKMLSNKKILSLKHYFINLAVLKIYNSTRTYASVKIFQMLLKNTLDGTQ